MNKYISHLFKRIISFALAICLMVVLFPVNVYGQTDEAESVNEQDNNYVETTPAPTIEVTPEVTPTISPEITPEITPTITPESTPEVTPTATPEATVETTPEVIPETTPTITPEIAPTDAPEVTPEITPEVSPEVEPEVEPKMMMFNNMELSTVNDVDISLNTNFNPSTNSQSSFVANNSSTYSITVKMNVNVAGEYKLVVKIPKGITLSEYPTISNTAVSQYLKNGSQSISKTTDANGDTVLAYEFNSNMSELSFSITLKPTALLRDNTSYNTIFQMENNEGIVNSETYSVTMIDYSERLGAIQQTYSGSATIVNNSDSYVVSPYLYFYNNYYYYTFKYDSMKIVVPLSNDGEIGYYANNAFNKFSDKQSLTLKYGSTEVGTVTYYNLWKTYDTSVEYTVPILVYNLNSAHPFCDGGYSFFLSSSHNGDIRIRYSNDEILEKMGESDSFTYKTDYRSSVSVGVGEDEIQIMSTSSNKYTLHTFSNPPAKYLTLYGGVNSLSYSLSNQVLNIKDVSYFRSYIQSNIAGWIDSLTVEYTFDPLLSVYKLEGRNLSNSTKTQTASIKYKTKNGQDKEYSAELSKTSTAFILEDETDAIVWAEITYKNVNATSTPAYLLYAYVYNSTDVDTNALTKTKITSVSSANLSNDEITKFTSSSEVSTYAYLRKSISRDLTSSVSKSSVSKGDSFIIYFNATQAKYDNPTFYVLMPSGYTFNGYEKPYGLNDYDYSLSTKKIEVSQELETKTGIDKGSYILYTVKYEGEDILIGANNHQMKFTVGTSVDTSVYQPKVYVPTLLYMTSENSVFSFSNNSIDYFDFDGDNNTEEKMHSPTTKSSFSVNAASSLSIQTFLTSSYGGASEGVSQSFLDGDSGSYKYDIYNGLSSGASVKDVETIIVLPKQGSQVTYDGKTYTSQYDVYLNGSIQNASDFFSNATVTYSTDGITYNSSYQDRKKITHVKVTSNSSKSLLQNEGATFSIPLEVSFNGSTSSASKAYVSSSSNYQVSNQASRGEVKLGVNTLDTVSRLFKGIVYHDYNGSLSREDSEKVRQSQYSVYLYKGEYSSGTTGLTYVSSGYTSATDASYSFTSGIYQLGKYTIRVQKDNAIYFPSSLTGWVFDDNYAYYTYEITKASSNYLELPLIPARTMTTSGFTSGGYLYDNESPQITVTPSPSLTSSESVTYSSSNTNVVTVSSTGVLTKVADGNATITVSVPQLSALGNQVDSSISQTFNVKVRSATYGVTLHTSGRTLNKQGYTLKEDTTDTYLGAQTSGISLTLPVSSDLSYINTDFEFLGWYANSSLTGTQVTEIEADNYSSHEYWGKFVMYETKYETQEDTWVYGTFKSALANVYSGGTIKVLKNLTFSETLEISKEITLKANGSEASIDFNDYSLCVTGDGSVTVDDENLSIISESENGTILFSDNSSGDVVFSLMSGNIVNADDEYPALKNIGVATIKLFGGRLSGGYGLINSGDLEISGAPTIESEIYDLVIDGSINIVGELTNETPYLLHHASPTDIDILSSENDVDYSSNFVTSAQGYKIGLGSENKLVLKQVIEIIPTMNQSKIQGEDDPIFSYTTRPEVQLDGELGRIEGELVGYYKFTLGTLDGGDDYHLVLTDLNEFEVKTIPYLVSIDTRMLDKVPNTTDVTLSNNVLMEYQGFNIYLYFEIYDKRRTKKYK